MRCVRQTSPLMAVRAQSVTLRASLAVLLCVSVLGVARPADAAEAGYLRTFSITFPIAGAVQTADTYHANRGGGSRRHQAVDIFAPKGTPVYAARGGVITRITGLTEPPPYYGYVISIAGDDGLTYNYMHMNNDTPGTDDGAGGAANAYAAGLRRGARVQRGQLLGYLGDSGNAEETPSHLHFEMRDPRLSDRRISVVPYQPDRLNPFPSLMAARRRGDVPRAIVLRRGERSPAVAAWQAQLNTAQGRKVLPVTGWFGPQTTSATVRLQRSLGIGGDGVVGPVTLAAAEDHIGTRIGPPVPPPKPPDGGYLRLTVPPQRGAEVASFQRRLRDLGYRNGLGEPLSVDGVFGPATHEAARQFQRRAGLEPLGIVGPKTLAALDRAEQRRASARSWPGRYLQLTSPPMRGRDVAAFQQQLRALGYRDDRGRPLAVDGIFGPGTDHAVRAFIDRTSGLANVAVVGPRTWSAAFR